jgi:hypothetical protein
MMPSRTRTLLPVSVLAFALAGVSAAGEQAGVLWESTSEMSVDGMPMKMPAKTMKVCSAKEWTRPPAGGDENCKNTNFEKNGSKATWSVDCAGEMPMKGEGEMTFAGEIVEVYPDGEARKPKARARDIIEALLATNGVSATRPANVTIDGRRGLSTDLTPIDSERIELFATNGTTYLLEPDRTTRIVVMDLRKATILMAIEPHEGSELADVLATADDAAGTMRWR